MSFGPGQTPFGLFDSDPDFQSDADKIVDYTRKKLGDPIMYVHMSSSQIYASFEEAAQEYSAIVNSYQAKSVLAQFLGASTGSLSGSENTFPSWNLEMQKRIGDAYGAEGGVGGDQTVYSGSIMLETGVQKYDLQAAVTGTLSGSLAGKRLRLKELFHFSPVQAYRFFGTTSAINYLNNQFKFESFTPETIFYLLPIWEDILRGMQFETSNRVRRSNYSYECMNNQLTVYPAPTDALQLWFTYTVPADATVPAQIETPTGTVDDPRFHGVANLSNVPFGNIQYSKLNSISKQWIRRFAYELSKEVEGQIRSKMATIPIPEGDLTLNGPQLISDSREEQRRLREELKQLLEETTYSKLMTQQAEMAEATRQAILNSPLKIYIG